MMRASIALVIAISASPAWADARTDKVAQGQALARQGDYAQAIAAFQQAEATSPHAEHDCLIALAEFRRGELEAAQAGFARCRSRAASMTPPWVVPTWVANEEADLALEIDMKPDGQPSIVEEPPAVREPTQVVEPRIVPDHAPRRHPWAVPTLAAGGAILVAGALVHIIAVRPARADLVDVTAAEYDDRIDAFETRRNITIGLYAAGAAVTIVGAVLALRTPDDGPQLAASVGGDHALIVVGWSR